MQKKKVVPWGIENFNKTFEVFQTSKELWVKSQVVMHDPAGRLLLKQGFQPLYKKARPAELRDGLFYGLVVFYT
jgi:hypothetical protein